MKQSVWDDIARSTGRHLSEHQHDLLIRYREWLVSEAIPAGGLGPSEAERIDLRHIADSLLFASQIAPDVELVWDFGSGVGLPGIPLAILCPQIEFRLVDRSRKRIDLLKRVVRVLRLPNVVVMHGDHRVIEPCEVLVSRATIPPEKTSSWLKTTLSPGGIALFGGSWAEKPVIAGWSSLDVGTEVLDQPVWILMMRNQ